MTETQEPKYEIRDGRIFNRQSGEAIPDDEPIMIFRARDKHAAEAIRRYGDKCQDWLHRGIVYARAEQFDRWARHHPERMKEPDTAPMQPRAERESE